MTDKTKTLFIKTWGCSMNAYDSARMADILAPFGYALTEDAAQADLVIFNTCHIREKATEKLFSELGRLRAHQLARQAEGRDMMIAVGGCVAQAEGAEIQRRAPYVDFVFGPQTYHRLPDMLARSARDHGHLVDTDFPPESKFDFLPAQHTQTRVCVGLAIQEGCDRFCSYCVVPYTRGAEYARSTDAVLQEAKALVDEGAREITLLGQNVNAWRDGKNGLSDLLRRLAEIPDLERLRYLTSHPCAMDDDLIAAHRDIPSLMPYLHLPIQSGSDRILALMNRKHTADDYRRLIARLRKARPDMALSSDFIVGFPGETDADFQATLDVVADVGFAQAFSFKYSRRAGTPAASMADQVPETVKRERLKILQGILTQQQDRFNDQSTGQTLLVLVENPLRGGFLFGRTPYMQAVRVKGPESLVGQVVPVKITTSGRNRMLGEIDPLAPTSRAPY